MAMGLYRGVNNVARKVTKIYRGVSNVARKVTKGYRGVSNVARQFFSSRLYLYNNGDKCTDNSGGWTYVKYLNSGYLDSNTSITYNSDHMTMFAIHTGNRKNGDSSLYTKNKIDLSKYSKLCIKVSGYCHGTDISEASACVFNTLPTTYNKATFHKLLRINSDYQTILTIDISNINISCNIGFWVYAVSGNKDAKINIHEVWLEE